MNGPRIVDLAPGMRWTAEQSAALRETGAYWCAPARPVTVEEAVPLLREADVAILPPLRGRFTDDDFAAMPRLRGMATCTTNVAWIDLAAAERHGVEVRPLRAYGAPSVAEYVFATALHANRRLDAVTDPRVRDRPALRGADLYGRTAGVIGAGAIGRRCAAIAAGFGMRVLVHNRTRREGLEHVPLSDLLRRSDLVVVSVAATEETRNLLDADRIALLREDAVLVSVARESVLDVEAAVRAASSGRIRRFVFELDDPVDEARAERFANVSGVTATRHIAWYTSDAEERERAEVLANVRALSGAPAPVRRPGIR